MIADYSWGNPDVQEVNRLVNRRYLSSAEMSSSVLWLRRLRQHDDDTLRRIAAGSGREQSYIDTDKRRGCDVRQWQQSEDFCRASLTAEIKRRAEAGRCGDD